MTIQSALNSTLGDISNVAFRSGIMQHAKKTEKWFGEKPTKTHPTREEKKQNKIQEEYEKSGQARADVNALASYEA